MDKRHVVGGLLAVVVLYVAALTGGCAHARPPRAAAPELARIAEREALSAFQCSGRTPETEQEENEDRAERFSALKLALAVDHVRMTRHSSPTDRYMFAAQGEACATSTDRSACEAKLADLEARGLSTPRVFAITIAGDHLALYEGRELLPLLGAIDNPSKAWLAMMVHENEPWYLCMDAEWYGYRTTAGGYDIAWGWTESVCPVRRMQAIGHVDRDGRYRRLRTKVVEVSDACLRD